VRRSVPDNSPPPRRRYHLFSPLAPHHCICLLPHTPSHCLPHPCTFHCIPPFLPCLALPLFVAAAAATWWGLLLHAPGSLATFLSSSSFSSASATSFLVSVVWASPVGRRCARLNAVHERPPCRARARAHTAIFCLASRWSDEPVRGNTTPAPLCALPLPLPARYLGPPCGVSRHFNYHGHWFHWTCLFRFGLTAFCTILYLRTQRDLVNALVRRAFSGRPVTALTPPFGMVSLAPHTPATIARYPCLIFTPHSDLVGSERTVRTVIVTPGPAPRASPRVPTVTRTAMDGAATPQHFRRYAFQGRAPVAAVPSLSSAHQTLCCTQAHLRHRATNCARAAPRASSLPYRWRFWH